MRIITISREFGSGGRELGKRLAELLQIAYYDKEIITAIAQKNQLSEAYVSDIIDKGLSRTYPITMQRSFSFPTYLQESTSKILVQQQRIIKELAAQGDCVIMGQSADVILRDRNPLNIFVYADMPSKIIRCRERETAEEHFTDTELQKKIRQVDTKRARGHELLGKHKWGEKEAYHLCVNTSGLVIKSLAPQIAEYAKYWFEREK